MRIFFTFSASALDGYLAKKDELSSTSYNTALATLIDRSLFNSLHCTNRTLIGHKLSVIDSEVLQKKWADEQHLSWNSDWQVKTLAAQIEEAAPDVLYTNNPAWVSQHWKELPPVKLKAAWRAAPVGEYEDYTCFQLGLSYASHYLDLLKDKGVPHRELLQFSFDPELKNRFSAYPQDIDICFVGRYIKMFSKRNSLLKDIYQEYRDKHKIVYHLLTGRRLKGLLPDLPWGMLGAYKKPVFLDDLLKVFMRSKIVINAHSNIAGNYKGNMRVFEALGTASFMLSDQGNYPDHLIPNEHFATYKNNDELLEKIDYFLQKDTERSAIAQQAYEAVSQHYSTDIGNQRLKEIFENYCV